MQTTILSIDSSFPRETEEKINHLLRSLPYQPIWQSIDWNIMIKKAGGEQCGWFVGVFEEQALLGFCILEQRSLGLSFYGLFSLGWPVIAPICDTQAIISSLTAALKSLQKNKSIVFVQLEPLIDYPFPKDFSASTYKKFITTRTALIDLAKSEEEILILMKPKGRYNIRLAERHGIQVTQEPLNDSNIDRFLDLLSETTERDGFAINNRQFYEVLSEYLAEEHRWILLFAKKGDIVVAAGIFCFFQKTALYYYGASPSDHELRKLMGTYMLQWEAIKEAKKRGCETFDLLGIMGENGEDKHLSGVTEFKLKIASRCETWPPAQTLIFSHPLFLLLRCLRYIKYLILPKR